MILFFMVYTIISKYTNEMPTAWQIAMRKIWKLYHRTPNNLICNIISNFTHSLEKIHISLIYTALHHRNQLVRLLLHVKLASASSVFAENVRYLSFKYQKTRRLMHSSCRLLPDYIVCNITQRNNIWRANTCDTALKFLNEEITSYIQKHKQNLWKEHLDAHLDHRHNMHILWNTIHGLSTTEHFHPH